MCFYFAEVVQLKGNHSGFVTELFSLTLRAVVLQIQIIQTCRMVPLLPHHQMEERNLWSVRWIFTVHQ